MPEGVEHPEPTPPVSVIIAEATPHRRFTEAQRQAIRFLTFSAPVACAECGRRRTGHWTMRRPFTALTCPPTSFVLAASGRVHAPMTPVCRTHLLAPADSAPTGAPEA